MMAVILAGGRGTRLRPLTVTVPKPLLPLGDQSILEIVLSQLQAHGFTRVVITRGHMARLFAAVIGDGSRWGMRIDYVFEHEPLGTAGPLRCIDDLADDFLVMNGDILTTSDFGSLHAFHQSHGADVTVAAVDYRINIPFGVIHTEGPYVSGLVEKPSQRFLCNAGIYAVSPEALERVPLGHPSNMTDLIESCLQSGRRVAVFPVHEYWSDIGTPADLESARHQFAENT